MQKSIYLDYAATTPCDPRVIAAMQPYFFDHFGNASSPHRFGQEAKKAMENAREELANLIGANASEIVFNSGATEGNNHAIFGVAHALSDRGKHILVSTVEHHSVLEPIEQLARQGFDVTYIDVDQQGVVDPQKLSAEIKEDTIFIAVMHASNEIGTIQPVVDIGGIAREHNIHFHVDAVQTVGHIDVDVKTIGCDTLSLSAHKFYGPKGVGALFIRQGAKINKLIWGGDQERERRASTQNVSGIVGLGEAVKLAKTLMLDEANAQIKWRNGVIVQVLEKIPDAQCNGHRTRRLPNNLHFSFPQVEAESLIASLDMNGIAVSMGSACTSGALEPSHVLRAIGLTDELAYGSVRVTLGRWTQKEELDYFVSQLVEKVNVLKI